MPLRFFSLLFASLATIGLFIGPVAADEIDELRERLEKLEQQNAQLLERLDRSSKSSLTDSDQDLTENGSTEGGSNGISDPQFTTDSKVKKPSETERPEKEPEWYQVGSDLKMTATWKNGLEIETANKDFRVHVGGRTQMDLSFFAAENDVQFAPGGTGPIQDGFDFRRARLRADGTMWEQIEWVIEYDFVNSDGASFAPAPTDGYFTFTRLPFLGNVRAGLQKDPIGMEHLTSSRFLSFMERSFNQDAWYGGFNNGFVPGVTVFDSFAEERGTYWAGIYKVTTNAFQVATGGGEWAAVGRLTALPWYVDEGRGLIHLGGSLRHARPDDGTVRYRVRGPERAGFSSAWPLYANTGTLNADYQNQANAEFAAVFGPLNFQADYMFSQAHGAFTPASPGARDVLYHGGYVEALYFLTGEHRHYNRKSAVFDRVTPVENFFWTESDCGPIHGWGAWQVGVRYNHLDLNDKGLNGGILDDVTFGLNWFLNPNLKLQSNYSLTQRDGLGPSNGLIQGLGFRIAHDF